MGTKSLRPESICAQRRKLRERPREEFPTQDHAHTRALVTQCLLLHTASAAQPLCPPGSVPRLAQRLQGRGADRVDALKEVKYESKTAGAGLPQSSMREMLTAGF